MAAPALPRKLRDPLLWSGTALVLLLTLHFAQDLARGEPARLGVRDGVFAAGAALFLLLLGVGVALHVAERPAGASLLLVLGLVAAGFLTGGHLLALGDSLGRVAADDGIPGVAAVVAGVAVGLGTAALAARIVLRA